MKKIYRTLLIILGILILLGGIYAVVLPILNPPVARKPAVYLYPLQDSFISVNLEVNGKIIESIPDYKEGWNVFVTKEGIIENNLDYLFYEAKLNKLKIPKEGFVVSSSDLDSWFDKNLKEMGLNEKELSQFKEYWISELNGSKYYIIKLLFDDFLTQNMNLLVSPTPDTMIRLNFYFKGVDKIVKLEEPVITTPVRNGFTVVEWGGILEE